MGIPQTARLEPRHDDRASRKLDALLPPPSLPFFQDKKKKKKPAGLQGGTSGISLPHLSTIVCMDFVDATCYVDIQRWDGARMRTVGPDTLHASLGGWRRFWRDGGGRMARAKAAEFRAALQAIPRPSLAEEDVFGDGSGSDTDTDADAYAGAGRAA